MLRYVVTLVLALVLSMDAAGCGKKEATPVAPGQAANNGSGTAGNPNAGAGGAGGAGSAGGGAAAGGGGTDTKQPAGGTAGGAAGGTANKPAEQLPVLTKDQFDKITTGTTVESLTKLAGTSGKLVEDKGDRKTYQFQLKDMPKHYANVVFNKGQYLEKSIFMM